MRKKREKIDNCGSTNTEEEFPPLEFHVACLSLSVVYKLVLRKHSPDYLWLAATPIGFITSIIWPSHNHLSVITQFALLLILITIKFNLFTIRWQYTVLKYVSLNIKNAKFFTTPSKFLMLQGS